MKTIALALAAVMTCALPASAQKAARAPQQIEVVLTEYEILMPDTIAAGPVVFHIVNRGTIPHSFVIAGNGIIKELTPRLYPEDRARMEMVIDPGEYEVYCPVANHKMEGMRLTLKVVK